MTATTTTTTTTTTSEDVLIDALRTHHLTAKVVDVDIYQKGLSIDTDYIIEIQSTDPNHPFTYMISKTYHQFRKYCKKGKEASELSVGSSNHPKQLSDTAKFVIKYTDDIRKIIENEPVEYFAKVSLKYVRKLSAERTKRLNEALKTMVERIPHYNEVPTFDPNDPGVQLLRYATESFFLTDHVVEEGKEVPDYLRKEDSTKSVGGGTKKNTASRPDRFQMATKKRASVIDRTKTAEALSKNQSGLVLEEQSDDDDDADDKIKQNEAAKKAAAAAACIGTSGGVLKHKSNAAAGTKTLKKKGEDSKTNNSNLMSFMIVIPVLIALVFGLKKAGLQTVEVSADIELLICFVCYSFGYQVHRHLSTGKENKTTNANFGSPNIEAVGTTVEQMTGTMSDDVLSQKANRAMSLAILRKSMAASVLPGGSSHGTGAAQRVSSRRALMVAITEGDEDEDLLVDEVFDSTLLTPLRTFPKGGDPLMEENCVDEAPASDYHVRGPNYLVDKVKVPSGPILFPFRGADFFLTDECPEHVGRSPHIMGGTLRDVPTFIINFRLPFGVMLFYYEIPSKFLPYLSKRYEPSWYSRDVPSIDNMTPSEKCVARYLMGDDEYKKERLKLVPKVVTGPWLVKSAVGSKPAIIGNKLPVDYFYSPASSDGTQQPYFEADCDIVSNKTARNILGIVRGAAHSLTIDLGFVIEGKQPDELSEQMLVGTRVYRLDLLSASLLPSLPKPHIVRDEENDDDEDSD